MKKLHKAIAKIWDWINHEYVTFALLTILLVISLGTGNSLAAMAWAMSILYFTLVLSGDKVIDSGEELITIQNDIIQTQDRIITDQEQQIASLIQITRGAVHEYEELRVSTDSSANTQVH
jgi:hypothetical protein